MKFEFDKDSKIGINGQEISKLKICKHCGFPLVQFDITIEMDGKKTYRHNHCQEVVKIVTSE